MTERYSGANWIRQMCRTWNKPQPSPFGCKVADILGAVYRGIYHLEGRYLQRSEWHNDRFIGVRVRRQLATWDFNELTMLVVLCHDAAIRLSVDAASNGMLELTFHPRKREGGMCTRHPTIEEAVEMARRLIPAGDPGPVAEMADANAERA
jgi:hypothetical protein